MMRTALKNNVALIALSMALTGCASISQWNLPFLRRSENALAKPPADPLLAAEIGVASDLDAAIREAQALRKRGDLTGATLTLSQIMLVAPDDVRVLGEYGKVLVAKNQTDDAIAFLRRAIELSPNDWTLYSAQGVAYDQRGNYAFAQASYARALQLKPEEPTVLSNAGLSQIQSGNLENAETLLRRAITEDAGNQRIAQNLAMVQDLRRSQPGSSDAFLGLFGTRPASAPQVSATSEARVAIPAPAPIVAAPIAPVAPPPVAAAPVAPAPVAAASEPTPVASAPARALTGVEALANDPTVVLGPIPKETPPRATAPRRAVAAAPQRPAARPAPAAAPANVTAQADTTGLRRLRTP